MGDDQLRKVVNRLFQLVFAQRAVIGHRYFSFAIGFRTRPARGGMLVRQ
jgi:hypothetical protein